MRIRRSIMRAGLLLGLLVLVLGACGGEVQSGGAAQDGITTAADTEEEQDTQKIRFGYQASLWGAPLILSEIEGFWDESGLDVQSQRFSAGKDVRDALLSGSVDAGSIGAAPFIVAASTGELRMVAVAGYLGDTVCAVAKNGSGIETVEDLEGKNVAARSGSITELIFLTKVLPAFGMSEQDINLRNVSFDDQVAALTTGEVDAFVGLEPFISVAQEQGIGSCIQQFGEYDILPNIFAVDAEFMDGNEQAVVDAVRSYMDATHFIQESFEEAAAALHEDFTEQGLEISQEALSAALEQVDVNPLLNDEVRQYLEEQATVLIEEGNLEEMPDWDQVIATEIQEQAMTEYWAEKAGG